MLSPRSSRICGQFFAKRATRVFYAGSGHGQSGGIQTLKPTEAWDSRYRRVKDEVIELGISPERFQAKS